MPKKIIIIGAEMAGKQKTPSENDALLNLNIATNTDITGIHHYIKHWVRI